MPWSGAYAQAVKDALSGLLVEEAVAIVFKAMYVKRSTVPHGTSHLCMLVQAVGDALSGVLMVEAALRRRQWGLQQWGELYQDLPSRQSKVQVQDRSVISTINAETCVASPAGLQPLIDTSVAGQSET